jgi:hypothetical protein
MLTKLVAGVLREILEESTPLVGGTSQTIITGITASDAVKSRALAFLILSDLVSVPAITATLTIVDRKLAVVITNNAANTTSATYKLDIALIGSPQQARDFATGVVHVLLNGNTIGTPLATANAPGAALNWPPAIPQLTEGVFVNAFSVIPKTAGAAPWDIDQNSYGNSGAGAGTFNHGTFVGYNTGYHSGKPTTPHKIGWFLGFESYYFNPDDSTYGPEFYLQYHNKENSAGYFRPLMVRVYGAEGEAAPSAGIGLDIGPAGGFAVQCGATDRLYITPALTLMKGDRIGFGGAINPIQISPDWSNVTFGGTSGAEIKLIVNSASTPYAGTSRSQIYTYAGGFVLGSVDALDLIFRTSSAERMRINASTGAITMASLAGTGLRTVKADANGVLSAP